jgi:transposase-like protein
MSIPALASLSDVFFNENACIQYLFEQHIFYNEMVCQYCGSNMEYKEERKAWRCGTKRCRREVSCTKDSFFYGQKLKCSKILFIGYLWLLQIKVAAIETITDCSSDTVAAYVKYYRQLVISSLDEEDSVIGGPGVVVEIDESKLGKRKYHRGHRVEGVWVLGGAERTDERNIFLCSVPDRSVRTLLEIISRHVRPNSIILTDMWRGYAQLRELGFEHRTVNHTEGFINHEDGTHTNTIEGTWNGVKLQIAPRNRVRADMDEHLLVIIWRRKNKERLWNALLDALRTVSMV